MIKKILFTFVTLFSLLFFFIIGECFADISAQLSQAKVNIQSLIKAGKDDDAQAAIDKMKADFAAEPNMPETLCWIAGEYRWMGNYETAKSMYQQIIQQYPAGSAANKAKLGISRIDVLSLIKAGKTKEALDATDKLIADFAGHPDLPETLYWTAKQFEWRLTYDEAKSKWNCLYDEAKRVYQQLIQSCPGSEFTGKAQVDFKRISHRTKIFSLIEAGGDDATIQAAIAELKADFTGKPELPSELYWVARKCEDYPAKQSLADALFKEILQQYPGSDSASNTKVDVIKRKIMPLMESGDSNGVQAVIDNLLTNFKGHPYLPEVIVMTGEKCFNRGFELTGKGLEKQAADYYGTAIKLFEIEISQFPVSEKTRDAYGFAADCYRYLGNYEKAIEYFQKMVDNWPNYERAAGAQFMVAFCYEQLGNSGQITKAEATVQIQKACEKIFADYPDSRAANIANDLLERLKIER